MMQPHLFGAALGSCLHGPAQHPAALSARCARHAGGAASAAMAVPTSAPAAVGAELILTSSSSFFSSTHIGLGPCLLLSPCSFSQGAWEMQERD